MEVTEVAMTLNHDNFRVNTYGDLPIYRETQFESGIKSWVQSQL